MSIRVLVNGAKGKTGQIAVEAVEHDSELVLVGQADRGDDLGEMIETTQAQVVVDFTAADAVLENALTIIGGGACPVIGTSGLMPEQITQLQLICRQMGVGGIIVPNFSISAILMMKFAAEAAQYFPKAEVVELHHDEKQDSPSGTAIKTAEVIARHMKFQDSGQQTTDTVAGARGADVDNVPVHSIRLPGMLSQHRVIFGAPGETFSIESNLTDRNAFRAGICLACRRVVELDALYYGLESVMGCSS